MQIKKQIKYVLALLLIVFPTTALAASVTLRWQANQEPDISSYNVYYGTQSRNYGLPIPAGNATSYTVDNLTEGETYYFSITAVDTSGNESGYSAEKLATAMSTSPTPSEPTNPATDTLQAVVLSTSADSPQPEGRMVQLTAQTVGGGLSYEYCFEFRKKGKSKWKTLRPFSTQPTYNWDTTGKVGKWELKVRVRDQNNPSKTLAADKMKVYKISANKPTRVSLSSNPLNPQPVGSTIRIQSAAEGGFGTYEYLYQVSQKKKGKWQKWQNATAWSTSAVLSGPVPEPGTFKVRALARIAGTSSGAVASTPIIFNAQ